VRSVPAREGAKIWGIWESGNTDPDPVRVEIRASVNWSHVEMARALKPPESIDLGPKYEAHFRRYHIRHALCHHRHNPRAS